MIYNIVLFINLRTNFFCVISYHRASLLSALLTGQLSQITSNIGVNIIFLNYISAYGSIQRIFFVTIAKTTIHVLDFFIDFIIGCKHNKMIVTKSGHEIIWKFIL